MISPIKKLSLIMIPCFLALFAVFTLLQFAKAWAVEAPVEKEAEPVLFPQSVDAGSPGAGPWLLVVNAAQSNMSVVNTADDTVHGPFLQDQLGSDGGGRFDVDITPNGRTALISNFGDSTVFIIDISNPISPSVITSVTIPFFAEDIDISPDGRFALVADGGFSPILASIDIASATVYTANLGAAQAQGVAVAPDGTVIFPNYFGRSIHTVLLEETGMITYANPITYANTYTFTFPGTTITDSNHMPTPVNIGLAPDGETIIVCSATTSTLGIYRIVSPGVLTFTGVVTGLHGDFEEHENFNPGVQSVAFNAAGTEAYAVVNAMRMGDITGTLSGDRLAVLNITGPGEVSLAAGGVATLPHKTSSQLFGVDTVAVASGKVYAGYPTLSSEDVERPLAIVDLNDYSVSSTMVLTYEMSIPTGVAVAPKVVYLPLILR